MTPLTKRGVKVLRRFKKEYGRYKGKSIFYAIMRKHPIKTRTWHLKRKRR